MRRSLALIGAQLIAAVAATTPGQAIPRNTWALGFGVGFEFKGGFTASYYFLENVALEVHSQYIPEMGSVGVDLVFRPLRDERPYLILGPSKLSGLGVHVAPGDSVGRICVTEESAILVGAGCELTTHRGWRQGGANGFLEVGSALIRGKTRITRDEAGRKNREILPHDGDRIFIGGGARWFSSQRR